MMNNHENDEDDQNQDKNSIDFIHQEPDTSRYLLKIRLRYWYSSFLIIIVVLSIVMIGSISTPRWTEQGTGGTKWRSGLLKCGGCHGKWTNTYLTQIVKDADNNNVSGYRSTFSDLRSGGYFYVLFEAFALVGTVGWIALIVGLMMRKLLFRELFVKILLIFIVISNTIAIAGWFGFTGARFSASCDVVSDYENSHPVCASHGPAMAVFIEVFLVCVSFGFYILFINREISKNLDKFILE